MNNNDQSSFTAQNIFNKVVAHLRQQGCQALNDNNVCVYRGKNGTKCAIGCLIPDDEYLPSFEGQHIFTILDNYSNYNFVATANLISHRILLVSLQVVHDTCPVNDWETEFKMIAERYKLQYNAPVVVNKYHNDEDDYYDKLSDLLDEFPIGMPGFRR